METMFMQNFGGRNNEYYSIFESGLYGSILSHSALHYPIDPEPLSIPKLMQQLAT